MCSHFANTLEFIKIFSAPPSKDIKTFFIKGLCCHIASYTTQLVPLEILLLNSYLSSTVEKTHHGPVIASFYVQLLQLF